MAVTVERLKAVVEADTKKATAELKAFQAQVRAIAAGRYDVDIKVNQKGGLGGLVPQLNQLKEKADAATGSRSGGGLLGLGRQADRTGRSFRGLMRIAKFGLLIEGIPALIGPAVTSITSLVNATTALTAAVAPATGLLAAFPQGLAAIGQGATTAALGVKGLSAEYKRFEAAKTFEEQERALAVFTPQMREFVGVIREATPQIQSLQRVAGEGMLPGLNKAASELRPFLNTLRSALASTGTVLGDITSKFAAFASTPAFRSDFSRLAQSNSNLMRIYADAALKLTEAFTHLMVAAEPLTTWLAQATARWAESVRVWAQQGRETDRLSKFFEKTISVTQRLGSILGGLGGTLMNVGRAAQPLGDHLLGSLDRLLQRTKDWTGQSGNLQRMTTYFNGFKEPLGALGRLVKGLVDAWMELNNNQATTRFLDTITDDLLPAITNLGKSVQESFGPAVIKTVSSLADMMAKLMENGGSLTTMVQVVGRLADALGRLADFLGPLTGLITGLATLGAVSGIARRAFSGLGSGAAAAAGAVGALTVAWVMYKDAMSKAAAEGRQQATDIASQFDSIPLAEMNMQKLRSVIGGMDGDLQDMFKTLAGSNAPWDADKRAEIRAAYGEGAKLRDEWKALERQAIALARATGTNSDVTLQFLWAQRQAGTVFSTNEAALKAYNAALWENVKAQVAAQQAAITALSDAFATLNTLTDASAMADRDAADARYRYNQALKDAVVDTSALTSAQREAQDAALALSKSYHEAAEHLEDLRFGARRSVLSEARAVNALQDAYDRLAEIQKGVGKQTLDITRVTDDFTGKIYEVTRITADAADAADNQSERQKALRDALLDVQEAELAVEVAKDANMDAQLLLNDAERKGIMQSDIVIAAKRRMEAANKAVKDAVDSIRKAEEANQRAIIEAARAVEDADKRRIAAHQAVVDHVKGPMTDAILKMREEAIKTKFVIDELMRSTMATQVWSGITAAATDLFAKVWGTTTAAAGDTWRADRLRATGGQFGPNEMLRVGEHGVENIWTGANSGYVQSAGATARTNEMMGGVTRADLRALAEEIASMRPNVDVDQTFNEKVDPVAVGNNLAWKLAG